MNLLSWAENIKSAIYKKCNNLFEFVKKNQEIITRINEGLIVALIIINVLLVAGIYHTLLNNESVPKLEQSPTKVVEQPIDSTVDYPKPNQVSAQIDTIKSEPDSSNNAQSIESDSINTNIN